MSENYRLKKDLLDHRKGAILDKETCQKYVKFFSSLFIKPTFQEIDDYRDWFEEIPTKWKPEPDVQITRNNSCNCWFVNMFLDCPTKQAAEEMRDKIKELLGGEE